MLLLPDRRLKLYPLNHARLPLGFELRDIGLLFTSLHKDLSLALSIVRVKLLTIRKDACDIGMA
jgi:hypothetical protein